MSKIGNKPINLEGVEAKIDQYSLEVKGEKGSQILDIPLELEIEINKEKKKLTVKRKSDSSQAKALHGTYRALINNMVLGVKEGFRKELIYQGVGYKAEVQEQKLILNVGYSHPAEYNLPEGIKATVEDDRIIVEGINKQLVGQTAAEIRAIKPPDAYKGQGIRYANEKLLLKPGKAVAKGIEEK